MLLIALISEPLRCFGLSRGWLRTFHCALGVRFGSKADVCSAKRHVRFTPESGHQLSSATFPRSQLQYRRTLSSTE